MYILFTSIFFAKLIIFFRNEQKMSKKISATTKSNTDFLFCLLNGNFLDAAITIYHDIHALGRRGYSLSVERIAGDFLHIAAVCHLVNTCRVILNDVSKVFPDVSICISLFGSLRNIQGTIADHNIVEKGASFNWILPSDRLKSKFFHHAFSFY